MLAEFLQGSVFFVTREQNLLISGNPGIKHGEYKSIDSCWFDSVKGASEDNLFIFLFGLKWLVADTNLQAYSTFGQSQTILSHSECMCSGRT